MEMLGEVVHENCVGLTAIDGRNYVASPKQQAYFWDGENYFLYLRNSLRLPR